MHDRSALITGSSQGIGFAIAEAFARAGCGVTLHGLGDRDTLEATRVRLASDTGAHVELSQVDVSDGASIATMVAEHCKAHGGIDILVNNAGIQHVAPVDEFPVDKWNAILAINLSAAFHTTRAALPTMRGRGFGRIINIASAHGLVASEFKSAYVAAKHGLLGLTKVVALEVAKSAITCNAICPGYVRTPLVDQQIADQAAAHGISEERVIDEVILQKQPNKRFVPVDEIASLCCYLASAQASAVNGATLSIDGGWVAQ
ncbi:MAG: 3-hydroxybutyrate dehydrogenase [Myxococcota bacterium]